MRFANGELTAKSIVEAKRVTIVHFRMPIVAISDPSAIEGQWTKANERQYQRAGNESPDGRGKTCKEISTLYPNLRHD